MLQASTESIYKTPSIRSTRSSVAETVVRNTAGPRINFLQFGQSNKNMSPRKGPYVTPITMPRATSSCVDHASYQRKNPFNATASSSRNGARASGYNLPSPKEVQSTSVLQKTPTPYGVDVIDLVDEEDEVPSNEDAHRPSTKNSTDSHITDYWTGERLQRKLPANTLGFIAPKPLENGHQQ